MSPRYARITLVLLLVALVPTIVNSYIGAVADDGPVLAETVPASPDGFTSVPTNRRDASIRRSFDSTDWVERRYVRGADDVTVLVVRSFDMKRLYHHPELAVTSGTEYRPGRVEQMEGATGPLNVHVLEGQRSGITTYALVYGDETVAQPLWFQLRVAPELLLRGRRPLTLVMARHEGHVPGSREDGVTGGPAVALVRTMVDTLRQRSGE